MLRLEITQITRHRPRAQQSAKQRGWRAVEETGGGAEETSTEAARELMPVGMRAGGE